MIGSKEEIGAGKDYVIIALIAALMEMMHGVIMDDPARVGIIEEEEGVAGDSACGYGGAIKMMDMGMKGVPDTDLDKKKDDNMKDDDGKEEPSSEEKSEQDKIQDKEQDHGQWIKTEIPEHIGIILKAHIGLGDGVMI